VETETLASLRDLSIVIVALEVIVVNIMMVVLIIQITRLIRLMRDEVLPILYSTQETVSTMRGTATFVGDRVVQPVVRISSFSAGVRGAISSLFRVPSESQRGPATEGGKTNE
jgi:hypothetical protein